MEYTMRPGEIALWVLKYLGIMLLYTLLDVALWRKAFPGQARWLNLLTMGLCRLPCSVGTGRADAEAIC